MNQFARRMARIECATIPDRSSAITGICRSLIGKDGKIIRRIFKGLGATPEEREANRLKLEANWDNAS